MTDETFEIELDKISDRIRLWREESGLSRQELADLSGVAASTVHKVETRQMIPSVAVVLKLAHGLGRRPAEIMAEGMPEVTVSIQRAGDQQLTTTPTGRFERLTAELIAGEMEVWRVTLQPAAASGSPLRFDGEVFIQCEQGTVDLEIGGHSHTLATNDIAHFKATHAFTYQNKTDLPTTIILAATLPVELRSVLQAHATISQNS
ncbi:MAG: helix-turn-helix domain-containing protein [Acidobacteria bacterium]|nr:helix-turn-helix domain-containing protein [Acidobacteriota bacterium]